MESMANTTAERTGAYRLATSGGVLLPSTIWCVEGRSLPTNLTVAGVSVSYKLDADERP